MSAAVPRDGGPTPASGQSSRPPSARSAQLLAWLPPAWTITAALAVVYLILAPPSPDLSAATYRSDLFSRVGFTLWDNSWYGGHHLPAYSLLAPALGALIAPRLIVAISTSGATALFVAVIDGWFPARAARIAGAWFALGASIAMLSSRVPYDLGFAIGLGAVLAARRRRPALALALSVLTALASPVAGAFLALAFLAWALAGPQRAWPAALSVAALAPIALLALLFPEGGTQPFAASAFYPALAGVLVILALVEPEQRMLRIGLALYALALTGSYFAASAVGGNVDRLGALTAGPMAALALACACARGRRRALLALAPLLLYWQANAPVADFVSTLNNPSVNASFYTPLIGELRRLGIGYGARPARIEVATTADHWDARYLAPHVMIARGWERQLDVYRDKLFYEAIPLTAGRYQAWLAENAISYVALPDAPLDYSSVAEARLLKTTRPAYLHEVWRSPRWRLFAVIGAKPLAQAPAVLTSASTNSLTVYAPRPGSYTVRVHFTSYWELAGGDGCVSRAPGDWTRVQARRAGTLRVIIGFSLARVFDHGPRCD